MAGMMKDAHVYSDSSVTVHEVPIPKIVHPSLILVNVFVLGTNRKVMNAPSHHRKASTFNLTVEMTGLEAASWHTVTHPRLLQQRRRRRRHRVRSRHHCDRPLRRISCGRPPRARSCWR